MVCQHIWRPVCSMGRYAMFRSLPLYVIPCAYLPMCQPSSVDDASYVPNSAPALAPAPSQHSFGTIHICKQLLLARLHQRLRGNLPHQRFQCPTMHPSQRLQLHQLLNFRRQLPVRDELMADSCVSMHREKLWGWCSLRGGGHYRQCM